MSTVGVKCFGKTVYVCTECRLLIACLQCFKTICAKCSSDKNNKKIILVVILIFNFTGLSLSFRFSCTDVGGLPQSHEKQLFPFSVGLEILSLR